jgi:hypothetical protein
LGGGGLTIAKAILSSGNDFVVRDLPITGAV